MMHDGIPGTKRGLLFVIAVFAIFLQAGLWSARRKAQEVFPDNSLIPKPRLLDLVKGTSGTTVNEHPIPKLMAEAELKFRERLSRQSKTLAQAVAEYRKRFKRDPPRGFDDWWKFAQDNGVLMVDDYNAISEDLEPFWDLSPAEFRLRASLVSIQFTRFVFCSHTKLRYNVGWSFAFSRCSEGSRRRGQGREHQRWIRQSRRCQRPC